MVTEYLVQICPFVSEQLFQFNQETTLVLPTQIHYGQQLKEELI